MKPARGRTVAAAAAALQRRALFQRLRETLERLPGISGVLDVLPGFERLDATGFWFLGFDAAATPEGKATLQVLSDVFDECARKGPRLTGHQFSLIIVVRAGYVIHATTDEPGVEASAAIPPDVVADFVDRHFEAGRQNEARHRQMINKLEGDVRANCAMRWRRNHPSLPVPELQLVWPDPRKSVMTVVVHGRPIAAYRFWRRGSVYLWRFLEP